jgi:hypothetical protein
MLDARAIIERQYHDMRQRVLSLAADFDRIERATGGAEVVSSDPRLAELRDCLRVAIGPGPERARRVQEILSDKTPTPI